MEYWERCDLVSPLLTLLLDVVHDELWCSFKRAKLQGTRHGCKITIVFQLDSLQHYSLHNVAHDIAKSFKNLPEFQLSSISFKLEPIQNRFETSREEFGLSAKNEFRVLSLSHGLDSQVDEVLSLFIVRESLCRYSWAYFELPLAIDLLEESRVVLLILFLTHALF